MKIKTITCHEVYNHGATLQEYALLNYLENLGHEAETIHYKPEYFGDIYNLWSVYNDFYKKNILLKCVYLILKFPQRVKNLKRKRNFDLFSEKHIKATKELYKTNDDLIKNVPEADAYICGSDQIWNTLFPNGKDPAFYLDFVPKNKRKMSYAASFAIDELEESVKEFVKDKVSKLNHIAVRESSGKTILENLGITNATQVLDPVFLLSPLQWSKLMNDKYLQNEKYIFIYDFDGNEQIKETALFLKKKYHWNIVSINENIKYADKNYYLEGPDVFLSLIKNAKFVLSNSFHALAFSLIFNKNFIAFNRQEKINTRMRDLLMSLNLPHLLFNESYSTKKIKENTIEYESVNAKLQDMITHSKDFLKKSLE